VRSPQRRARLAAAGRKRADEYSWPRVTSRVLSYYERLRDDRAAHARTLLASARRRD